MRTPLLLFIFLACMAVVSCEDKDPSYSQEESQAYLEKIRKTYGGDNIFNSTIAFSKNGLYYTVERKDHILNSSISRVNKGIHYFSTYKNGHIQYFINDTLQDDKTYKRKFLDVQLDGFVYTTFIPQVFNTTDILIQRQKEVIIRNKTYNVINVSTKPVEDADITIDNFYLYIDPETNYVSYIAQDHELSAPIAIFKKFYNYREVQGILFADYFSFSDEDTSTPIDSLYTKYNDASLTELKDIKYTNIQVQINN